MAVDDKEGPLEKIKDFFTQKPEDRAYEDNGGDDRVSEADRTDDPKADAKAYAASVGEDDPYPDYTPSVTTESPAADGDTLVDTSGGVPVDATPTPTPEETSTPVEFPGEGQPGYQAEGRSV